MKPVGKQSYKVISAVLELKRFTQYRISKEKSVSFSLVNKIVNWLVSRGYVVKRKGFYELVAAGAVFNLFPIYRKMAPFATFDVDVKREKVIELVKGRGVLCLSSAFSFYDDYYRDPAVYLYANDERLVNELRELPKGYTHVELYQEDLHGNGVVKLKWQLVTDEVRTVVDLFCSNKAYAAERFIKREWK